MDNPTPKTVTVQEAAALLHISQDAVLKRIARGTLSAIKENGRWAIHFPDTTSPDNPTRQDKPSGSAKSADIERLQQRIAALETALQERTEERDHWRTTCQQALQALHNQQALALPDRLKEVQALPESPTQARPWWKQLLPRPKR